MMKNSFVFVAKNAQTAEKFNKLLNRFDWDRATRFLYVKKDLSVKIVLENNLQNIRGYHPDVIYTEQEFSSIDFFNILNIYGTKIRSFSKMTY